MEKLPENVYSIIDNPPTREQADNKGRVLYYSASAGWSSGYYAGSYMKDVTHWTFCPEAPPVVESPSERVEHKFNVWMKEAHPDADPALRSLLRMGFFAAFKSLGINL